MNGEVAVPASIEHPAALSGSAASLLLAGSIPHPTSSNFTEEQQNRIRHVRIFVSSPADTDHERGRVARVVERLNGEFSGAARVETIRWETEFYRADTSFQCQIPQAAECDIVIAIFRHRLGTELPRTFARLPDGTAYPSGTAYEVLTAIDAYQHQGYPDVYVFRHPDPPMVRLDDPTAEQTQQQWRRLKEFFDTWFQAADGPFKAAFQSFGTIDDFEAQLDRLLRGWLEKKVLRGRSMPWPIEVKGSPFRGLAAFGTKHAPVFFGRSRDVTRAVDQWKEAAARGPPFLILVGASGAGKSSLARAGLVPRITAPGVVPAVDLWRVAVMHPSEEPGGPIISLATRLFDAEQDIPEEERGRPPALPEIAEGDYHTPTELAHLFAEAGSAAALPIIGALDRAAEAERDRHGYQRRLRGGLIIVIDQLDELFGPDVTPEERSSFTRLLTVFAETGRVWLLATVRADLYDRLLAEPALMGLKTRGAAYDLSPPGPAELAEIVRKPAEAAGLVFEMDARTGEGLDERLLREADRPDMLPLLQLALNRLFEGRIACGDAAMLTIAAYQSLGGLAGVVDREAERAIFGLGESEIAQLPQLLRRLAAIGHLDGAEAGAGPGRLTVRTVPFVEAASNAPSRRLIQALVEARILLTSGEGAAAGIRLAHQRVLTDWTRARGLVAASAEFYRIRDEVEEQRRRWQIARRSRDLLISRGLPLAEAESIAKRFGDELSSDTREFIAASARRARMRHRLTSAAAVLFAVLALSAAGAGISAWRQEQRAEQSLDAAEHAVNVIVVKIAHGLRNVEGVRTETIQTVLENIQDTVEWLSRFAPKDRGLSRLHLEMLDEFTITYETAGDIKRARKSAKKALAFARALANRNPEDPEWRRDISVVLNKLGSLNLRSGEAAEAFKAYQEALAIMRPLAERDQSNGLWQRDLAISLNGIGDVQAQRGDSSGALAAYHEGLALIRRLAQSDPANLELQREIAVRLNQTGDIKLSVGDAAGAIGDYEEGLSITRALVSRDPGNTQWQRDVFFSLTKIGDMRAQAGDGAAAAVSYAEAVAIVRHLAVLDPSNPLLLLDIAQGLCKIGDVKLDNAERDARDALYEEALTIMRRLVQRDPHNFAWQRALSVSLNKVGDVKLLKGDASGALAGYAEGLTIVAHLVELDPGNFLLVRDVALSRNNIGEVSFRTGDSTGAIANFEQALQNMRLLSEHDPGNTLWLRDLTVTLNRLGDAKSRVGDYSAAAGNYTESLTTVRRLAERDPGNALWQWDLWYALSKLGAARISLGDRAAARNSYGEGLTMVRRLAAGDPDNVQRQTDLVINLYRIAGVEDDANRTRALEEALAILERLRVQGTLTPDKIGWPDSIREMLAFFP